MFYFYLVKVSSKGITKFKHVKTTLCDVEHSFRKYKNILRSNRRPFYISENLKYHIVSYRYVMHFNT